MNYPGNTIPPAYVHYENFTYTQRSAGPAARSRCLRGRLGERSPKRRGELGSEPGVDFRLPPRRGGEPHQLVARTRPSGRPRARRTNRLSGNPERRFLLVELDPFRDPAGNVAGVAAIAIDVTDRVRSEKQVRAGQRLLRRVLETLPVGVVVLNRAGDVVLHNPASAHIWGATIVSRQERWAKSKGFWHGSGHAIDAGQWASQRALEEGQTSRGELIDHNTFAGERKPIDNSAGPIL